MNFVFLRSEYGFNYFHPRLNIQVLCPFNHFFLKRTFSQENKDDIYMFFRKSLNYIYQKQGIFAINKKSHEKQNRFVSQVIFFDKFRIFFLGLQKVWDTVVD